ncbi:MAG: GDP-mannose 4,6-dehydratase [Candidatus Limnocylindria bacterium]
MPRRVLLTGITGFAGNHLAARLLELGDEVHGLAHEPAPHPNIERIAADVRIHAGDLTDLAAVRSALAAARPEVVFHLAAQAIPTLASEDPLGAISVNVLGTATLLQAVAAQGGLRLVHASSADVYGDPDRVPVTEDAPLRPRNVYAATKAAAEPLVRELGDRGSNSVTILRPANQIGPRQHPGLAASAFARQIAEAEAGLAEPVIRHGRLDARRDFIDVRDMAEAYALAAGLSHQRSETYNVGSGSAPSVEWILATLVGLARVPVRTEIDPSRVRPGEPAILALDASRFRARTGWAPRIPIERSLADTLDHWRSVVARPVAARP